MEFLTSAIDEDSCRPHVPAALPRKELSTHRIQLLCVDLSTFGDLLCHLLQGKVKFPSPVEKIFFNSITAVEDPAMSS